jgi:prepilin-type N-terminal cleavage/methylation domain-containing protein
MLTLMHRHRQRRTGDDADHRGFTLIEVVVAIVLLGIIIVPLTAAFIQGLRRTGEVDRRLSRSADLQRITSYWNKDVNSVDALGVGPVEGECRGAADFDDEGNPLPSVSTPFVTFEWDTQLPGVVPKRVTWAVRGTERDAELVRVYCEAGVPVSEGVMADAFGAAGLDINQMIWGRTAGEFNPCDETTCTINVGGAYSYTVTAERRVPGEVGDTTPPAPEIVDCQAGPGQVLVTWNPSILNSSQSAVIEYQASVFGDAAGTGTPLATVYVDGTSTSATLPAVVDSGGEEFWVRVKARNNQGYGLFGPSCGPVVPDPSPPGKPANVVATPADKTASIDWTDPASGGSPITNYTIFQRDVKTGTETQFSTSSKPYQLAGGSLVNADPYQFAVQATNLLGTGERSEWSATIYPFGPTLPMNQPALSPLGGRRYRISWSIILPPSAPVCLNPPATEPEGSLARLVCISNGSPVTGYRVEMAGTDGANVFPVVGFPTTLAQPTLPANPQPDPGGMFVDTPVLVPGRDYFARITPINAAGDGAPGFVEFTIAADVPGPPGLPSIFNNGETGELDFVLRPPEDTGGSAITSYEIRDQGATRTATVDVASAPTTQSCPNPLQCTSFTWSDETTSGPALVNFERYLFNIRACNAVGCGAWSPLYRGMPVPVPELDLRDVTYTPDRRVTLEFTYAAGTGTSPATDPPLRNTFYNATCEGESTGNIFYTSATPVTATFGPFPLGPVSCNIIMQSRGETTDTGLPNSAAQATSPIPVPVTILEAPGATGAPSIAPTGLSAQLRFDIPQPADLGGGTIDDVEYLITGPSGRTATVPAVAGTTTYLWSGTGDTGPSLVDFARYDFTIAACNREGCGPATAALPGMPLPTPQVSGLAPSVPANGTARVTFAYAPGTGWSPAEASPLRSTTYTASCGGAPVETTFVSGAPVGVNFPGLPVAPVWCSVILRNTGVATSAGSVTSATVLSGAATTGQFLVAAPPATPTIESNQQSQQLRFRVTEAMPAEVVSIGIERVGGGQPNVTPTPLSTLTPAQGFLWTNTSATVQLANFQRHLFRLRSCNADGVCSPWSAEYRAMTAPRPKLELISSESPSPGVASATFTFDPLTGVAPPSADPFVNIRWRFVCNGIQEPVDDLADFTSNAPVTATISGLPAGPATCTLTTRSRIESTLNGVASTRELSPSPSTISVPVVVQ